MDRRPSTLTTLALGLGLSGAACRPEPVVDDRPVHFNTLAACPVAADRAYSVVVGWGDFEPASPQIGSFFLRAPGASLGAISADARVLVADVTQPGPAAAWLGVGAVPPSGPVDLLLLPHGAACPFSAPLERRVESAMAALDQGHVLVAGGMSARGQVPRTYVGDLARGTLTALAVGLGARRLSPSITPFDAGAGVGAGVGGAAFTGAFGGLVAGGAEPGSRAPLATAEVYLAGGDFAAEKIALNDARAEHGAVRLVSGETLLVGGRGASGLLATLEAVEPRSRRARTGGLAVLSVPRARPTVLRLASGEVLVAGGEDANGAPVGALEWLAPDASRLTLPRRDLPASRAAAFVALAGGGALAVLAAPRGASSDWRSVWVIGADGSVAPQLPVQELAGDSATLSLFDAGDGAPLLHTGRRWLRWQPWFGAFQQLVDAPETSAEAIGPRGGLLAAPDPGLAVWLEDRDDTTSLRAFRHGSRGAHAPVPRPLLVKDEGPLAPDRAPSRGELRFDVSRGLLLREGASVFLPDVSFAAVTIELRVTAASPLVVLRDAAGVERVVGGPDCPGAVARDVLRVSRAGSRVTYAVDDGEARPCSTNLEEGRVSIGLRGRPGSTESGARNLFVRRE
ncbi:MAG TPA: hypothetical protein PK141_24990 [Polyangiaceae bacterium]|nr:hypothetical protein [Polyangiaceae bacterium]